jgi:hypothetical protein
MGSSGSDILTGGRSVPFSDAKGSAKTCSPIGREAAPTAGAVGAGGCSAAPPHQWKPTQHPINQSRLIFCMKYEPNLFFILTPLSIWFRRVPGSISCSLRS